MELNLKYYKGKDEYSDGAIEDKIIKLIKKYPNNYEEALKEDKSWPVFYHLSDIRKNVIRWYPFKEDASILEVGAGMGAITEELCQKCKSVTSIELSKKRATAILERNKNVDNLEIIVGNFNDVFLEKKYDYILLNGVLEYGALYIESDNPYEDFIIKLKKYLKPNGKILVAIENRFGLKYWCGANEDHTGIPFDGINGYKTNKNIKTFSKNELENLASNCKLNINFYYMFPDYKFPKVIYTDQALEKNVYVDYTPYYYMKMNILAWENKLFKNIYDNKTISFFANSYFIELSQEKEDIVVEFAKFNNEYRKDKYNLCTYLKDNKFYKKAINDCSISKLEQIKKIDNILKARNVKTTKIISEKDEIYSESINGISLSDILNRYYQNNKIEDIYKEYDKIYELMKKCLGKEVKKTKKTIFDKYNINLPQKDLDKMHFYENGIIDIIPNNIIVSNNEYVLIDQEWFEENTPIEYVMYRAIYTLSLFFSEELIKDLYKKYNIDYKIYEKLDKAFLNDVRGNRYEVYTSFTNNINYISNLNELENMKNYLQKENKNLLEQVAFVNREKEKIESDATKQIEALEKKNHQDEKQIEELEKIKFQNEEKINELVLDQRDLIDYNKSLINQINSITNSKSWKYTQFIRDYKLKKQKKKSKLNIINNKESILFFIHAWVNLTDKNITNIGGTTLHLLDIINNIKNEVNCYVLTVINNNYCLVVFENDTQKIYDLHLRVKTNYFDKYDFNFMSLVFELIDNLKIDMVHIHHFKNFPCDLQFLPKRIKTIVTLHDYFSICPKIQLINYNNKLCINGKRLDCAKCTKNYNIDFETRNNAVKNLLENASMVIAPNECVFLELKNYFKIKNKVVIAHGINLNESNNKRKKAKKDFKVKNVAFIGVLTEHKGLNIVKDLIKNNKDEIEYHLFGTSTDETLNYNQTNYTYHGIYNQKELANKLIDNNIDLIIFPAIWPETFSYTLSEILVAGIPCVAYNLGAIADRIKKDKVGWVINKQENFEYTDFIKMYPKIFNKANYNEVLENIKKYKNKNINEMMEETKKYYQQENCKTKNYDDINDYLEKYGIKYVI